MRSTTIPRVTTAARGLPVAVVLAISMVLFASGGQEVAGQSDGAPRPAQGRTGSVIYLPIVEQERAEPFDIVADLAPTQALDVQGALVYVAAGRSVLVLDVSERTEGRPIGRTELLPGIAVDVAVDGEMMAVAVQIQRPGEALAGAILLCDISDGRAPRIMGRLDILAPPKAIALAGDTLFLVGHATGLWTVDVSQPSDPRVSGREGRFVGQDLVVVGDTVFVVGSQALTLLDVTDPAAPSILGSLGGIGPLPRLSVAGTRAYVTEAASEGAFNGVRIVDVSDRRAPQQVAQIALDEIARQAAVAGDALYVLHHDLQMPVTPRITVYNLAEPDRPVELAQVDTALSAITLLNGNMDMAVEDGRLVTQVTSSVVVFDLDAPPVPRERRSVFVGDVIGDLVASGDTAVFATYDALEIVDVRDPSLPRRAGRLAYGVAPEIATVRDLALQDGLVYALGNTRDPGFVYRPALAIYDVRNPRQARRLATLDTVGNYERLAVEGDTVVLLGPDSVAIVDIANPEAPRLLADHELAAEGEYQWHLALSDDRLWVTSAVGGYPREGQIATFDLRDRSRPVPLGATRFTGYPYDLAIEGDRAYVSTRCGVHVFRQGDDAPHLVGVEPSCSPDRDLAGPLLPMGDYVLTVMPGGVIREIDVRRPEAPQQRSSARLPSNATELARVGDTILALDGNYLMFVRYRH